jgi:hypothetical protein
MAEVADLVIADVAELLTRYSFDLEAYPLNHWIDHWLVQYPLEWLPKAVIEALYQGRYKAVSVWQILDLWRRRGKPLHHFSREFERIISGRSLQILSSSQQPIITVPEPQSLLVSTVNGTASNRAESSRRLSTERAWLQNQAIHFPMPASQLEQNRLILPANRDISTSADDQAARGIDGRSVHLTIQPFKPPAQFKLTLPSRYRHFGEAGAQPIQRFVPAPEQSELHDKLKSMAQSPSPTQSDVISSPDSTVTTEQLEPAKPEPDSAHIKFRPADLAEVTESESSEAIDPDAEAQPVKPDFEDQAGQ